MTDATGYPFRNLRRDSGRLKRWIFARHSNPLSAWSRWASIPLVVAPFWTRERSMAAGVAGWMLLNPVVFPEPHDDRAWSTKAMLGEEQWSGTLRIDAAFFINVASTAAMAVSIFGARRRSLRVTLPAAATQMALTLVFWKLMADYYEQKRISSERSEGP